MRRPPMRAHLRTLFVLGAFAALAAGTAPARVEDEAPPAPPVDPAPPPPPQGSAAVPPGAAPAAEGPLAPPGVFAIPDPASGAPTELPRAGVRLRLSPGVRVSESGRFASGPQAGPYIGLVLPGGREVQVDALDADVEWSRQEAARQAESGQTTVLHSAPSELVTQPPGIDGCRVSVCRAFGAGQLCASTGALSVLGQEGTTYPPLRDCGILVAVVRSIEPL